MSTLAVIKNILCWTGKMNLRKIPMSKLSG